ncbi:MAG: SDR family oxidoreductase [Candidatus Doudnabacteria bacterium]|nr:SDR family oxidoreductase [Candidatus Doudnabacteria bacterium]
MSKVVFISGGSRGIGAATVLRFAREKFDIAFTYNEGQGEASAVAEKAKSLGSPEVLTMRLDMENDENIRNVVKIAHEKFGKIDILINNAGTFERGTLSEQTFAVIHRQIAANLEGMIKLTHEFLPYVKEAIINIASVVGFLGKPRISVYTATKWGVRGFTKSLAREYPDLRIYVVNPGLTDTRMGRPEGMPAEKVAETIFDAATGKRRLASGSDIAVKSNLYFLKSLMKKLLGR